MAKKQASEVLGDVKGGIITEETRKQEDPVQTLGGLESAYAMNLMPIIESIRLHEPTQFLNVSTAAYSIKDPAQQGLKLSFFTDIGILIEFKGIKRVVTFNNIRSFEIA